MPTDPINDTASPVTVICGTLLLLAVLAGVFMLTWHGQITGEGALGVVGTVIGIGGGVFAVHTGAKTNGKSNTSVITAAVSGGNPPGNLPTS